MMLQFKELLENALQGQPLALEQWLDDSDRNRFTSKEIKYAMDIFNKLSDSTNRKEKSYSLYLQALWYQSGVIGVVNDKIDFLKAMNLYDEAINLDNVDAMYNKAIMYLEVHSSMLNNLGNIDDEARIYFGGDGCEKTKDKGIDLLERAIKLKSAKAMNIRAKIYFDDGVEQNSIELRNKARALYSQAIQLNDPQSMCDRAYMYESCAFEEENPDTNRLELYRKASQLGHERAKAFLAETHDYLLKEALQGQALALEQWTKDSQTKSVTPLEIEQSREVFSTLLDSKEKSYALHLQALWHYWGAINGEANYPEASRLYEEAIKLKNVDAMNNRAMMYVNDSHYDEAINLLDEAIRLGNVSAMNNRAYMYEYGLGETDCDKAMALYQRAFYLGYAHAKQNLEKLRDRIESCKDSIRAIENTLDTFKKEIVGIHHHFLEAKNKGEELLGQLTNYKDAYREALLASSTKEVEIIGKQFKKNCQDAIAQARPLLERDLRWGDYLINLLKALANAVMKGATLGQVNPNSLFTYKKAELVGVVDKVELSLGPRL